jgi:hypothetical protein
LGEIEEEPEVMPGDPGRCREMWGRNREIQNVRSRVHTGRYKEPGGGTGRCEGGKGRLWEETEICDREVQENPGRYTKTPGKRRKNGGRSGRGVDLGKI